MNRAPRSLLIGAAALALAVSGGVVAGGWQNAPAQDATPAADPIGDVLRPTPPQEAAPAAAPAPAAPIAITPPPPRRDRLRSARGKGGCRRGDADDEDKAKDDGEPPRTRPSAWPQTRPSPRQRRRVAIIEAIDKITAETHAVRGRGRRRRCASRA